DLNPGIISSLNGTAPSCEVELVRYGCALPTELRPRFLPAPRRLIGFREHDEGRQPRMPRARIEYIAQLSCCRRLSSPPCCSPPLRRRYPVLSARVATTIDFRDGPVFTQPGPIPAATPIGRTSDRCNFLQAAIGQLWSRDFKDSVGGADDESIEIRE